MRARQRWQRSLVSSALMIGALVVVSVASAQNFFGQQQDFLSPEQAFQPTLSQDGRQLAVDWEIAPGYYLYRHSLNAETDGQQLTLDLPEGEVIEDEYFGRSEVYRYALNMTTQLEGSDQVTLSWQGCADAGLCYPPQTRTFDLDSDPNSGLNSGLGDKPNSIASGPETSAPSAPADTNTANATTAPASAGENLADDQRLAAQLAEGDRFWTLAAFFGMGLLLTFTPCVLPMIPILSSLIMGQQQRQGQRRWTTGFVLSLAYVLPMAITYALLGVAAAMAGANLQMLFQNVWFIGLFSALFVLLALAMFGVFNLELPNALRQRLDSWMARQRGGRLKGVALMGVISAVLVGPCMTAPLAGGLLFIAETGDPWLGGAALLALGLGMGAPLVLIGTVGGHLLPRPGAWMARVRGFFGFVLLGMAIWFVARILPDAIVLGLWGAVGLGLAVALRFLARSIAKDGVLSQLATASALVIGLWSSLVLIGAAGGGNDPLRPLAVYTPGIAASSAAAPQTLSFDTIDDLATLQSRVAPQSSNGRMTLVEFTAEWCVSCEVIKHEVFGDPGVQAELQDVQRLSVDVTDYDADDKAIMQHFGVVGPPTLMWFGPDGEEVRSERIIGELSAEDFLQRYTRARQASDTATEG
ncbi:protein-disulfide reductase DsbD [Halomonas huangheensis]|uniref:Thiol:disulfide interchange protein DsbD n=1 Tax=Halomonas huangheensis TaxID=1178482 RepID=W1N338_9GAMM|nr:protein-disulfide reductase DsbD [Halomonas huangheensis]ALM51468.1 thiol:disulfide interchange protein [Halomonas huangheensis]ERL49923.1 hypothetical protein BJB45_02020 [Halomonas huangheensis]